MGSQKKNMHNVTSKHTWARKTIVHAKHNQV